MSSRRQFIRRCCSLATAGASAELLRLGQMQALAQTTSNYKALVCIFLFGGNDGNNMVIPIDAARYAAYKAMRPNIALADTSLLPVTGGGLAYGLHPRLTNIQRLYNQKRAAMVLNVGTLFQPTTRAMLQNGTATVPKNLYSHSDQTLQWQTTNTQGAGGPGWGGRIADFLAASNASQFPMGVSVNGSAALLQGVASRPINLTPGQMLGLNSFGDGNAMTARSAGMQQLLTFDTGMQMIGAASGIMSNAIKGAADINKALTSGTPITTVFPNSGLGNQLKQVATVMRVRQALGMSKQIFFCGMGGFDNHSDQLPTHDNLMGTIDAAIGAFLAATDELGVSDSVTTFTESEFGRTGNPSSSNGSDHAWGSHHFVFGGPNSLNGGQSYGKFPVHALNTGDDAGNRGLWIPNVALDQYAATMGAWFGLGSGDLNTIFPNLKNFPAQTIGFMK